MRIKAIILLCFLFTNGCISIGKNYNKLLVISNNREYITNCKASFTVWLILFVLPALESKQGSCDEIYINKDKFSILHNGKLYTPIQIGDYYAIKIDVNKLKEDKEAKVVYENGKLEAFSMYEEQMFIYGLANSTNATENKAKPKKKLLISD